MAAACRNVVMTQEYGSLPESVNHHATVNTEHNLSLIHIMTLVTGVKGYSKVFVKTRQ